MKRIAAVCSIILLLAGIIFLCQTASEPDAYRGCWYSADDQTQYRFEDGLIYCAKHPVSLSEEDYISGAYTYRKNSVYLFAAGVEGLLQEKQIYLVRKQEGSFLCEREDGSGKIYFIRSEK